MVALMDAVPLVAAELMVKLGVDAPSLLSVKARVPAMEASSAPEPEVSPEKAPESLIASISKLLLALSSPPRPSLTVYSNLIVPLSLASGV